MTSNEPVQRVRIYLNERDTSAGQPLYLAVLERLRRDGATGATTMRGIAGFGAAHRVRAASVDTVATIPIVVEWIDRAERVARVLPLLDDLVPEALITVEDVQIYRAALRSSGAFGDRVVRDVMRGEVATISAELPARGAAERMLAIHQPVLPLLDENGRIAAVLSDGDLVRRAGLPLPIALLGALPEVERASILDRLSLTTSGAVATAEPRTIYVEASIPQAISPLIEWGFAMLPVADREGKLVGLFGIEEALRAARRDLVDTHSAVRDAEPPTQVSLVMQANVATVAATTPAAEALSQLLATRDRFLVVSAEGRAVGALSAADVLAGVAGAQRAAWLAALTAPDDAATLSEAFGAMTAGDIANHEPATIAARATLQQAVAALLDGGHERLIVVGDDGTLVGLLARQAVLRALAQENN